MTFYDGASPIGTGTLNGSGQANYVKFVNQTAVGGTLSIDVKQFGGSGYWVVNGLQVAQVGSSNFTIYASAGSGGAIDPTGTVDVPSGTDKMFSITANPGYMIDQVLVDSVNNPAAVTSGSYTFTNVTANHTIAATFKTTFANWIGGYDVGTKTGQVDDADGDGQNNLTEFALCGTPNNGADNGKVYVLTEVASDYSPTAKVLILTIAARAGTPAQWDPMNTATIDGVKYTIEGGTDLSFTGGSIWSLPTAINTGLPLDPPAGYEYRRFVLQGSDNLPDKGFLRVRVEPTVP